MTVAVTKDHVVDFYQRDERLVERVGAYLVAGLVEGDAAVIVATPEHRASIESALVAAGFDLARARASGSWVALDAGEALQELRPNGTISAAAFERCVGTVMRAVTAGGRRARVYGEIVQLLWEQGDVNGAIALESLWNQMGRHLDFSLYCAYRLGEESDGRSADVDAICQLHSEVAHRHGSVTPRQAHADFEARPTSPGDARRFLRSTLGRWGMACGSEGAELVLTELTTNALLHARSEFRVVVMEGPDWLRISVHDRNRNLPCRYASDPEAFSGRGLALIEALSAQWGCAVRSDGKEVWAELALSTEPLV